MERIFRYFVSTFLFFIFFPLLLLAYMHMGRRAWGLLFCVCFILFYFCIVLYIEYRRMC
jgi:hypothetical protein